MLDLSLLKAELAIYGINVNDDGTCSIAKGRQRESSSIEQELIALQDAIKANKQFTRELWRELISLLSSTNSGISGNNITQKLFSSAILWLYDLSGKFKQLVKENMLLSLYVKKDISVFSEAFMSKVVQYRISIDWMDHIIRIGLYKIRLLKMFNKQKMSNTVVAQAGPWVGGLYLDDAERVIDARDEDGNEDRIHDGKYAPRAPFDKENLLPETYNDPNQFEAGFYLREIRGEPYAFDDPDDNPYPHRNLLWQ